MEELEERVNTVLAVVHQHIDYYKDEIDLLVDKRGACLSLKNINYDPDRPLLTETLTILLKDVVTEFSSAITKVTIAVTEKVPRYRLWPWTKKTIGAEFSATVQSVILRGNIIIKPLNPQEAGELRPLITKSYDSDNKEVWLNPIIIGVEINLTKIQPQNK
ncbi:MAG: hypothetical protein PHG95_02280 [Patescibacteria group bacterium]|nr:hypothetical protein [Patescibacteria group bacterium]